MHTPYPPPLISGTRVFCTESLPIAAMSASFHSYTHFSSGLLSARPSGNHSPISRLALSTASDPWMTLRPTSMQKSPRMLPGSAEQDIACDACLPGGYDLERQDALHAWYQAQLPWHPAVIHLPTVQCWWKWGLMGESKGCICKGAPDARGLVAPTSFLPVATTPLPSHTVATTGPLHTAHKHSFQAPLLYHPVCSPGVRLLHAALPEWKAVSAVLHTGALCFNTACCLLSSIPSRFDMRSKAHLAIYFTRLW